MWPKFMGHEGDQEQMLGWKTPNRDQVGLEKHHHHHWEALEAIHHHHLRRQSLPAGQAPEEDDPERELKHLNQAGTEIPGSKYRTRQSSLEKVRKTLIPGGCVWKHTSRINHTCSQDQELNFSTVEDV